MERSAGTLLPGIELMDTCADTDLFKQAVGDVPPPALVLPDINMPRMDGFEVLAKHYGGVSLN